MSRWVDIDCLVEKDLLVAKKKIMIQYTSNSAEYSIAVSARARNHASPGLRY